MSDIIPLDINDVHIPREVVMSDVASAIVASLNHFGVRKKSDVPLGLKRFINKHFHDGAGSDWLMRLTNSVGEMPDSLLRQWFEVIPGGYHRAVMRMTMVDRGLINGAVDKNG